MEIVWPRDERHWLRAGVAAALARGNVLVINEGQPVVGLVAAAFGHSVNYVTEDTFAMEAGRQTAENLDVPCQFDSVRGLERFPDESFDTVILGDISSSEEAVEGGVEEGYRLCRGGGRLIILSTSASHTPGGLQSLQELRRLLGPFRPERLHFSPHISEPWLLAWCNKPRGQTKNKSSVKSIPSLPEQHYHGELVTVLLPTFNRAYLLKRTLDAIYAQTYRNIEVIVVDDGSTDHTSDIVRAHNGKPKYIRKANGGKSSALNVGIDEARGEYLWIADDDDLPLPCKLALQVPLLQANPAACLVYSSCFVFHGSPRNIIGFQSARKLPPEKLLRALLDQELGTSRTSLYRASAIKQVGGFDESLIRSQDLDILIRLARHFPMSWSPFPTVLYRVHAGMRGAATDRFHPGENENKWLAYNQKIYRKVYHGVGLSDLDPQVSDGTDPNRIASVLVFRAKVMLKKSLVEYASYDLEQALRYLRTAKDKSEHNIPADLLENVLEIQELAILHHAHKIKRKVWQTMKTICRLDLDFILPIVDHMVLKLKEGTVWERGYYLRCLASFAFGLDYPGSSAAVAYLLKRAAWSFRCRIFPVRPKRASQTRSKSRIDADLSS